MTCHLIVIVHLSFIALVASAHAQGPPRFADPDPRRVETQVGQSINLLCRIASPIISCRFQIPGLPDIKLNPSWPVQNENFRYYGNGLDKGQCGITITNVQESYHGNATCVLDPNDGLSDAVGNIEIIIAKPPQEPHITLDTKELEAGNTIEPICDSIDGRPAAALSWYLDDQPLGTGDIEIIGMEQENQNQEASYQTVRSHLRYTLKPEDHTKNLICRAKHSGYREGFSDVRIQLSVNFRPVPQGEIIVSGLEIGTSANIGPVTIHSNPRPTLKWTVDGTVINQGEQTQRFVASDPIQVGVGVWNATLTVVDLTLQDTTRTYKLRASNAFGTTDYQIRIGGSQDASGKHC